MAVLRARKVAALPVPTQESTLYVVDTNVAREKHIYQTDDDNGVTDRGIKTGFMVNKKLLAAA